MVEKDERVVVCNADSYGLSDALVRDILDALEAGDELRVKALVLPLHAADIADFFDVISHEQRELLVGFIRDELDPEIFLDLVPELKEELITLLGSSDSAQAITQLDTEDAVQVIEDLDEDGQQELLSELPDAQRVDLEQGLSYPEDSAGRLLQKQVVAVPQFWTVGQTIDFLRSEEDFPEDFFEIYVVDPKYRPVGAVSVSRVMRSTREVIINDLMHENLRTVQAEDDQEKVAFLFRQYGLVSAPVVSDTGRLIGSISMDDVVAVIDEEAEEDIMRLGGVIETDLHSDAGPTAIRRFPWLVVNLVTAIIASIVIGMFADTIEELVALAVLMPIVASMGGNAGTQTLTVAVRGIAAKELTMTNAFRVVMKETWAGGFNGILFALIAGVVVWWWYDDAMLSLVFGLSVVATLLLAGLAGALIPLVLSRMNVDPAIASSIFLTTVTDVVAFSAFLGLAAVILL